MQNIVVAEKKIVVASPPERVWRLLGKVIFSSLPEMESIEILDENNFRALLKAKLMHKEVVLKVKGEVVDIVPLEVFAVKLSLQSPGDFIALDQRVNFALTPLEEGKTIIDCQAVVEKMGFLTKLLLLSQIQRFAQNTFGAMEKRLQDLV